MRRTQISFKFSCNFFSFFYYRLLSFLSFYFFVDAFGLHIHIRLLKFCLSHWLSSADCYSSFDQSQ